MTNKIETYSTNGPICPNCGREYTADESHYYDDNGFTIDCDGGCRKTFEVEVHTSTSWTSTPIDDATGSTVRQSDLMGCRQSGYHFFEDGPHSRRIAAYPGSKDEDDALQKFALEHPNYIMPF